MKGGLEDFTSIDVQDDDEAPRPKSEVKNAEFETLFFGGVCNVVIPKEFPPKLKDLGSFSIPCMVDTVRINRALCELSASVSFSLIPFFRSLV